MKKWITRALRFWLVVLLPLGLYAIHEARASDADVASYEEEIHYWYPKLYRPQTDNSLARAGFDGAVSGRAMAQARKSSTISAATALLTFPIYAVAALAGGMWIWNGLPTSKKHRPVAVRPTVPR